MDLSASEPKKYFLSRCDFKKEDLVKVGDCDESSSEIDGKPFILLKVHDVIYMMNREVEKFQGILEVKKLFMFCGEFPKNFTIFLMFFVDFFKLSKIVVKFLLDKFKWNSEKLMDKFYEGSRDDLFNTVGLLNPLKRKFDAIDDQQKSCGICFNDFDEGGSDLKCGHKFCDSCISQYLVLQVEDFTERDAINCAGYCCKLIYDDEFVKNHLKLQVHRDKYEAMTVQTFIRHNKTLRSCPSPDCKFTVCDKTCSKRTVMCHCGIKFCFMCGNDVHFPLPCQLMNTWKNLLVTPAEKFSQEWIKTFTKNCPKCQVSISKEGGCSHMHCKQCNTHFCWICCTAYDQFGHKCSLYQPYQGEQIRQQAPHAFTLRFHANQNNEAEETLLRHHRVRQMFPNAILSQPKEEREHKFYYYKSRYCAVVDALKIETEKFSSPEFAFNTFTNKAFQCLTKCRTVLIQGYIFAFFMKPGNQKILFEQNFLNLGDATEELSQMMRSVDFTVAEIDEKLL